MSKHHKQCIGVLFIGFLLFIIIVIPASASSTVEGLILSTGYITYDSDADGVPEMAFCSDDLKKIGKGVDALNNNIAILTDKYDELATTSEEYREELISGLNGNVYAKANIPAEASYKDVIAKINNIPAPTTALGKYYTSGDNSGLGVGVSSSLQNAEVNIDGIKSLKLGINESITLPSGYYPENMTIHNNVLNRGNLNWNPAGSTSMDIPSGYYSGGKISTSSAYSQGRTDGYNDGYEKGKNDPTALQNAYNAGKNDAFWPAYEEGKRNGDIQHHIEVRTDYMGNSSVQMWIYVDGQQIGYNKDGDGNCHFEFDN